MILQTENINLHIRHYLECDVANREYKLAYTTLFWMWYCKQKTETCTYDYILECDIANRKQKLTHTTLFGMWYCKQKTETCTYDYILECDIASRKHEFAHTPIVGMWYCKQKTLTCTYDIIWNVILQKENVNLHIRHYLECDIANREHKLPHTTLFGMWYCKQNT